MHCCHLLRNNLPHPHSEFVALVKLELYPLLSVQAVDGQRRDIFSDPLQHRTNSLPHPQPSLGTQIDDLAVKTAQSPHPLNAGDGIVIRDKEA